MALLLRDIPVRDQDLIDKIRMIIHPVPGALNLQAIARWLRKRQHLRDRPTVDAKSNRRRTFAHTVAQNCPTNTVINLQTVHPRLKPNFVGLKLLLECAPESGQFGPEILTGLGF
ncbi:hypothetical protein [Pikeienuella sp. HZG-20]|uniref:hypothetical protein n=1 Tax=Paludibacillus litoralis TaxID=3133267 RepID=UPI0030EED96C